MWPAIIGAAATALSVGSSLYANKQHRQDVNESNDLQWQRTLELQKMQNLYNSPKEQMKRYSEAGLNPNLIYGGMSPVPASTASAGVTPTPQPFDANGAITTAANLYFQKQQMEETQRVNDATVAGSEAQREKTEEETDAIRTSNKMAEIDLQYHQEKIIAEINKLVKDGLVSEERANEIKANIKFIDQKTKTEEQTTELTRINKEAADENLKALGDFIEFQKKEYEARIRGINASTVHTYAQTDSVTSATRRAEELHVYDKKTAQQAVTQGKFQIRMLEATLTEEQKRLTIGTETMETQLKILKEELVKAETANDFDKIERITNIINSLADTAAKVGGIFTGMTKASTPAQVFRFNAVPTPK